MGWVESRGGMFLHRVSVVAVEGMGGSMPSSGSVISSSSFEMRSECSILRTVRAIPRKSGVFIEALVCVSEVRMAYKTAVV